MSSAGINSSGQPISGLNGDGQLGEGSGSGTYSAVPVEVLGDGTWSAVSAGLFHTCGVETGGALFCWGELGVWKVRSRWLHSTCRFTGSMQLHGVHAHTLTTFLPLLYPSTAYTI